MTPTLPLKAELTKLSRLLDRPQSELAELAELGSERLAQLREMLNDALFEATAEKLERMASASKIAPIPVAASIAQKVLSPPLAAGIAGLLEQDRAIKFARRLPPEFLAEVAVAMDPRKAAPVLARIPTKLAVEVGRILVDREDYVTMGRFVGALTDEALLASIGDISDAALLQIACVIEDRSNLDHLIDLVPSQRIANLIHAAGDNDLWSDALDLIGAVSPDRRGKLADIAAAQDESMLSSLVNAVHAEGLFDELLPVLEAMSPAGLSRIAKVGALHESEVLAAVLDTTISAGRWAATLPIIPGLPEHARRRLAELPRLTEPAVIAQVIDAAQQSDRWAALLPMVPALPEPVKRLVAETLAQRDPQVLDRLVAAAVVTDQWSALLPMISLLPDELRARASSATANLDKESLTAAMAAASGSGQLDTMLDVAAGMPAESRQSVVEVIVDNAEDDDLLGSTLPEEEQRELWTKLLGLADGAPAPLLGKLGERAAELQLDSVIPTIMAAADLTGSWRTGLELMAGADASLRENVIASAVTVPTDLLQRAAEQAEALGVTKRLGPLGMVFDAQLAGQLTDELRDRATALAGDAQATAEQAVELFTSFAGGALANPKQLAEDLASKIPGVGGFFGKLKRDRDTP